MTTKQIEAEKVKAMSKFEVASKIRQLLDDARKAYGPTEWDDAGLEEEILTLVTDEA